MQAEKWQRLNVFIRQQTQVAALADVRLSSAKIGGLLSVCFRLWSNMHDSLPSKPRQYVSEECWQRRVIAASRGNTHTPTYYGDTSAVIIQLARAVLKVKKTNQFLLFRSLKRVKRVATSSKTHASSDDTRDEAMLRNSPQTEEVLFSSSSVGTTSLNEMHKELTPKLLEGTEHKSLVSLQSFRIGTWLL